MTIIRVDGLPIQQGSKQAGITKAGRPYLYDVNSAELKAWRHKVACAADVGETYDCPVWLSIWFYLPKPKHPKFDDYPAVVPDIDKLTRAIHDALKDGALLADDSRVVDAHQHKRYADARHPVGVEIEIREMF